MTATDPLAAAVHAVVTEVFTSTTKHGDQAHLPDGTGLAYSVSARRGAESARHLCQDAAAAGHVTWRHILAEEVAEAFAEDDPVALRAELVQVAAVAIKWAEAIDRRTSA